MQGFWVCICYNWGDFDWLLPSVRVNTFSAILGRGSGSRTKLYVWFLKPDHRQSQRLCWQASWGKLPFLQQIWCRLFVAVSEGSCSQRLSHPTPTRPCFYAFLAQTPPFGRRAGVQLKHCSSASVLTSLSAGLADTSLPSDSWLRVVSLLQLGHFLSPVLQAHKAAGAIFWGLPQQRKTPSPLSVWHSWPVPDTVPWGSTEHCPCAFPTWPFDRTITGSESRLSPYFSLAHCLNWPSWHLAAQLSNHSKTHFKLLLKYK